MDTLIGIKRIFEKIHHAMLKSDDFTIISNNCWGGTVYKYFGMKFQSPTVGMYFFSDEYIKFLKNLKFYLSQPLVVKDIESSKYKEEIIRRGQSPLIGWLDDVEIVLLHYCNPEEAVKKWSYRLERVNYDNMIVKFNDQNLFRTEQLDEFENLSFKNKICFTGKAYQGHPSVIWFKEYDTVGFVENDTKMKHWRRYFDVIRYINHMKTGEYDEC